MTGSEIPYFIASRMVDAASSPFWCQLALCRHWLGLHYSQRSFPLSAATTLNSSPPLSLLRRGNFPSGSYTMGMTPCPFACRLDKNGRADFDWLGDFRDSRVRSATGSNSTVARERADVRSRQHSRRLWRFASPSKPAVHAHGKLWRPWPISGSRVTGNESGKLPFPRRGSRRAAVDLYCHSHPLLGCQKADTLAQSCRMGN